MIAAIAINYLGKLAQADIRLVYVFCNYKSQNDQSLYSLLSAFLKQLVQPRTDIATLVTHLYTYHLKQKSRLSLDEIFIALLTICSKHARVYIVADALDKYSDQDSTRSQLIKIPTEILLCESVFAKLFGKV
jgi:hypothetical protein